MLRIFAAALWLTATLWSVTAAPIAAEEPATKEPAELAAGHSMHGEAFNEGPRQAAYLMEGMGTIQFDISTSQPLAKKFFNQGVAQLHGFWYYEAERSFRQAAMLDPDCAMCYWGMALANVNNRKRAAAFIGEAVERKANASDREQMYIEAARRRFQDGPGGKKYSKKEIAQNYTRDLEELVLKYPDDIEARALFALQLWENERSEMPLASHAAVDAVLEDVFDKNPMHPAHHYRIHLWDKRKPSQALASAAMCGPSLPGIAHMWHMPGHTYSNLHRYQDAVWQQEASARVDHAHMMRDRIMPDQIHNFAHNNEWMIRNLQKIGRINDAVSLATNMIQLPRHPKFNSLKSGSAKYGRERLIQSLTMYRLWPQLLAAAQSKLIEAGDDDQSKIELTRHLGIAHALLGHEETARALSAELESRLEKVESELEELAPSTPVPAVKQELSATPPADGQPPQPISRAAVKKANELLQAEPSAATGQSKDASCDDKSAADEPAQENKPAEQKPAEEKTAEEKTAESKTAESKTAENKKASDKQTDDEKKAVANRQRREREQTARKKELESRRTQLKEAIAAIAAAQAATKGEWERAVELFDKAGSWDKLLKAEWLAEAGKVDAALELAQSQIKDNPGSVLPAAVATYVRWKARGSSEAKESLDKLREACSTSDLDTPLLARLEPLATELGYAAKWAKPPRPNSDIGNRPPLDSLGPMRYSPYNAPSWEAETSTGEPVSSAKYADKPVIVIFYLGFGCLHCMEQLQEFSPAAEKFREAGIELVAISTENRELLTKGMTAYDKQLEIPLMADPDLNAFKSFRCFDDFEKQPLHGTFLIDAQGRVLWQDISYEPFKDAEFLLKESRRLLSLPGR